MSIQSLFLYHHDCPTVYWLFISGHTPEHINCSFSISWSRKSKLWLHLSHLVALCNFRLLPLNVRSYQVQSYPYSRIHKVHNVQCDGHFVHFHCTESFLVSLKRYFLSQYLHYIFSQAWIYIDLLHHSSQSFDRRELEHILKHSICPWTRM